MAWKLVPYQRQQEEEENGGFDVGQLESGDGYTFSSSTVKHLMDFSFHLVEVEDADGEVAGTIIYVPNVAIADLFEVDKLE